LELHVEVISGRASAAGANGAIDYLGSGCFAFSAQASAVAIVSDSGKQDTESEAKSHSDQQNTLCSHTSAYIGGRPRGLNHMNSFSSAMLACRSSLPAYVGNPVPTSIFPLLCMSEGCEILAFSHHFSATFGGSGRQRQWNPRFSRAKSALFMLDFGQSGVARITRIV
jgi:hypothetical protein